MPREVTHSSVLAQELQRVQRALSASDSALAFSSRWPAGSNSSMASGSTSANAKRPTWDATTAGSTKTLGMPTLAAWHSLQPNRSELAR